jgi:hypothetical protein
MSDIVLDSFQQYIDKVISNNDIHTTGDTLNNNVLVDINIQLCTRIRLPIAQSLPLGDRTAEMNFILNLIRNEILKGNLSEIHIGDLTVCDLLRWSYIDIDTRRNCSEYAPVYGQCSQEYQFPKY